jgi:hypothetical protein
MADIPEILCDFAARDVNILALVGGDGTVQATLTELLTNHPFETLPTLAILPGGRSNMIAADAGLRSHGGRGMSQLLNLLSRSDFTSCVTERRILRVENIRGAGSQFGMFFGAAGICRAIKSSRRNFHSIGVNSDIASALTLAGSVIRLLAGRGGDDEICRGDSIGISLDNETPTTHSCLLLLATTLDRLLLRSRPFWTEKPGPLHFSYIAYPPKKLGFYAPRILYGGPNRQLPTDSYFSRDATSVRLRLAEAFTLDGEFFEPDPEKETVLSSDERANFIQL